MNGLLRNIYIHIIYRMYTYIYTLLLLNNVIIDGSVPLDNKNCTTYGNNENEKKKDFIIFFTF